MNIQAYDSVWREALYLKLRRLGFGGKTLDFIKSMYHNDNIKFLINGHLTCPLFLTQGVKQGKIDNQDLQKTDFCIPQVATCHHYCSQFSSAI